MSREVRADLKYSTCPKQLTATAMPSTRLAGVERQALKKFKLNNELFRLVCSGILLTPAVREVEIENTVRSRESAENKFPPEVRFGFRDWGPLERFGFGTHETAKVEKKRPATESN